MHHGGGGGDKCVQLDYAFSAIAAVLKLAPNPASGKGGNKMHIFEFVEIK